MVNNNKQGKQRQQWQTTSIKTSNASNGKQQRARQATPVMVKNAMQDKQRQQWQTTPSNILLILSIISRIVQKSSKNAPKLFPKPSKIHKNGPRASLGPPLEKVSKNDAKTMLWATTFGSHFFHQKSIKNQCKKSWKNQDPKTSIFDPQNVPKWSPKDIKNALKIYPKNDDEKLWKSMLKTW